MDTKFNIVKGNHAIEFFGAELPIMNQSTLSGSIGGCIFRQHNLNIINCSGGDQFIQEHKEQYDYLVRLWKEMDDKGISNGCYQFDDFCIMETASNTVSELQPADDVKDQYILTVVKGPVKTFTQGLNQEDKYEHFSIDAPVLSWNISRRRNAVINTEAFKKAAR